MEQSGLTSWGVDKLAVLYTLYVGVSGRYCWWGGGDESTIRIVLIHNASHLTTLRYMMCKYEIRFVNMKISVHSPVHS